MRMVDERAYGFSLPATLAHASDSFERLVDVLGSDARCDMSQVPGGAAAYVLARAAGPRRRLVIVTPDQDSARDMAADLRFMSGPSQAPEDGDARRVLHVPGFDISPYAEVAPDRASAMDRMATLFHLSQGLPWTHLVLPASALARRMPPPAALRHRAFCVRAAETVDRDELADALVRSGYMRVPVVEDPGSFAVRGALVDIYVPHRGQPVRIELDDDVVASLRAFDPETQRTAGELQELQVHPVRDILFGDAELARASQRISDLCDSVNMPSSKRRQLLEDLRSGRTFWGIESFLPAFYESLATLFDFVGDEVRWVLLRPLGMSDSLDRELGRARRDRDARLEDGRPAFAVEQHLLTEDELARTLASRPLTLIHDLTVGGEAEADEESPLQRLAAVHPESVIPVGAEDQAPLARALRERRATRSEAPLLPLVQRIRTWLDEGLRVCLTARSHTQAQRLRSLLRAHDLSCTQSSSFADARGPGLFVCVGSLHAGFVLAAQATACVTEQEIFGERGRPRDRRRQRPSAERAFVSDLRELQVGDFVVHEHHGIGRYLGLERKALPLSRFEELQGMRAISVEVLLLEYHGGDRLFVPITRLNQIDKYAGAEGTTPKLDRLGGQTFARAKSRARGQVRILADELLGLYASRVARQRPPMPVPGPEYEDFEATFPFEETPDQARAIEEVLHDLSTEHPMDRLVCGDVGFGKTEVAMRAAFLMAMNGRQVAILCPTTVLAQQHFVTFSERMRDYPVRVEMLSRFVSKKQQTQLVRHLKEGACDIVVGTHRLLSKDVHFGELGLLVVDEEQRFGVAHKERIKKLRSEVDVLTLSATPIPRTLQMAIGRLRDLSLITTPPVDRRAIRTFVTRWDDQIISDAIARELERGGQAFFVYNRIDGLYERAARLQTLVPSARIAVVHGRLKEATLERTMTDFVDGRYDILCTTAIIENGLDIPRVNTILIDRADLMGLAQLYQLRGRVGRSRERGYCYLISPPPSQMSDEARTRIQTLERFTYLGAGFQIASLDLEIRGAGDLLGAEQSGTVASVGLDLFMRMLEEAAAELRGETVSHSVDPELSVDIEHFIPEDYIDDVGVRLSIYKRLAAAADEETISELGREMEDRFGKPPAEALQLMRVSSLRPTLRRLRVLGCEANNQQVTLHFSNDTPLSSDKLIRLVASCTLWKLTPDMRLSRRFEHDPAFDAVDRARAVLAELEPL